MTAITTTRRGGSRFAPAARMEWIKLRSLRGTGWALAAAAAAVIAIAVVVGLREPAHPTAAQLARYDPTETGFAGLALAQVAAGVLGVLVMTGEYSSGLIRATLAAVPARRLVLAAKTAVFGAVMLAFSQVLAFAAFFAMRAALPAAAPHPALGQPGVLRAVIMAGLYLALIGLMGIGLGAIIRHTAAAVGALVAVLFAVPLVLAALPAAMSSSAERFMPVIIAENTLTAVRPVSPSLPLWAGFGLLCLYAAVLLGAGGWLLCRRDA